MTYKTRGIILKRSNYGEADRIVTIFSEDFGKIRVSAKGIRKIKSKLSGNLELFCLSNLNIAEGRNLDIVTGALIEKCYFNLRNNLSETQHAYYFSEIIEKLTEDKDPHSEIYHLLDNVLENLDDEKSEILIPYFEWNLLAELGYFPELHNCLECQKKVLGDEKIYFNFSRGGILCEKCKKADLEISVSSVKLLRLFLKHQISALEKLKLDNDTMSEVKRITRTYLNEISGKEFKTQRFVK